jgi:hypothetical protein
MTSMSPQERALLQEFLQRLVRIRGSEKDPHADALIAQAVAQQPDAAYLLVQRALLLEQALEAAKTEIAQLNDQVRGGGERGFLAGANRWGQTEQPAQRASLSVSGRPIPAGPAGAPPAPAAPSSGAPFGGFLGQAAATAAGVAGGAFLFQGLESLLGRHDRLGSQEKNEHLQGDAAEEATDARPSDADAHGITSDIDWDDFDGTDDTSSV